MKIKSIFNKAIKRILYGSAYNSDTYIKYLKKQGVSIGEGTIFYAPYKCVIDLQNPALLKIGNNVRITSGVTILTHDYSWSVIAGVYGECLGGVGKVHIGNNVFIGMNSIILKNVEIGDNIIIGAGSVVTKDCASNMVYAGNPAKPIMSINEYYNKKKKYRIDEIKSILNEIDYLSMDEKNSYLREYSPIFKSLNDQDLLTLLKDTGYYEKCLTFYKQNPNKYNSINDFINHIMLK